MTDPLLGRVHVSGVDAAYVGGNRVANHPRCAYTSSHGEITPATRNNLYRPRIKNLYLRRNESRRSDNRGGEGRAMGKPKCRAFRLLRYFHRSPLSLSRPLPLPPPGRLDRSVFHVTQLPRRAYHPYIFAKLWTRSFPSFANVSNILFIEYILFSFFPSFLRFFSRSFEKRSKYRKLEETESQVTN